jgi:hypothetical protein
MRIVMTQEYQDIVKGRFVHPDEFENVFENVNEILKFFSEETILGAMICDDDNAYIISTDGKYLTLWKARVERK